MLRPDRLVVRLKDEAVNILYQSIDVFEGRTKECLQELKFRVLEMKKRNYQVQEDEVRNFRSVFQWIQFAMKFPMLLFYWIYVAPFLFLARLFVSTALFFAGGWMVQLPKVRIVRILMRHADAKYKQIMEKILSSRLSELFYSCMSTLVEITILLLWPFDPPTEEEYVVEELFEDDDASEVVEYEEIERSEDDQPPQFRKTLKCMHHAVPTNLFRAKVRTGGRAPTPDLSERVESSSSSSVVLTPAARGLTQGPGAGADSPASFPPSPFSRAFVMNKTSERVVSVMFAARDRLRLEAQCVSRDEHSRLAAKEAQSTGQFGAFDPRQSSNGIALSCGNHCAIKIGKGLCSCCRSMIAVRTNTFVYMEFSITVSNAQQPSLGVGLSPPDCPLNVMVGSWPRSVGIYTDGQVLVSSNAFQSGSSEKILPGSTVGLLMFLPSLTTATSGDGSARRLTSDGSTPPEVTPSAALDGTSRKTICTFNINGKTVTLPDHALDPLKEVQTLNAPMYPTVSLFSENTRVWCRFCEADIVHRSREAMGAPPNVRIYSLDGSLLLDETE